MAKLMTLRIKVVVDGPKLAKMLKKAVAKIEAMSDDRINGFADHAAKIINQCVSFEVVDGVSNLPKDS